jgi:hypothetical protein
MKLVIEQQVSYDVLAKRFYVIHRGAPRLRRTL